MYTDEKKNGGLLKDFLLKLILIIIFVLLLIWLVPWPNMDSLNPLKDQIFNSNLQTMKEAGITYFTTERLPQEVGDKTTLTLQKMLDMKLLIPFTDRNGKSCDVTKSYVSLEKKETEYLMKVNLKCSEEEDYILVHLGCYSYCTTDICEAKPTSTEKPSTTPVVAKPTASTQPSTKPTTSPKPSVVPSTKPTTSPSPSPSPSPVPTPTYIPKACEVKDGKYYDKNAKETSYVIWQQQCTTPSPKPTPTPSVLPKACEVKNGKYYDKNAIETSYAVWQQQCTTPSPKPTPIVNKECEWKKEVAATYTDWSAWTEKVKKTNDGVVFELTDTKETVDLGTRYTQIGVIAPVYQQVKVTKPVKDIFGYYSYQVCTGYNYVADVKTVVRIDSDWYDVSSWYKGYNPPADTIDTRWIFKGIDYSQCGSDCTNHPYVIYQKQARKVTTYNEYSNVTANCASVETRSIPVYGTRTIAELQKVEIQPEQPKYAYVRYYKYRTRTLINEATTDYKWTDCGLSLAAEGYVATGKTRNK